MWACMYMHGKKKKKKRYGIVYYCRWLWICSQSKLAKWFGKYMTIERANICLWVLLSSLKKNKKIWSFPARSTTRLILFRMWIWPQSVILWPGDSRSILPVKWHTFISAQKGGVPWPPPTTIWEGTIILIRLDRITVCTSWYQQVLKAHQK